MFDVRKTVVVTVLAALLSLGAGAEERKIAVVNIATVFTSFKKVNDIQDKLKGEFEPRQNALDTEERVLKTKMAELTGESGEDAVKARAILQQKVDLELKKFDFQVKAKKLYTDIEEARKNQMKNVLDEIKLVIGAIGRRNNYDLVMRAPEFGEEFDKKKSGDKEEDTNISAAELVRRFRENPVLYFATGVDITNDVVELLNRSYQAEKAGK